MRDITKGFCIAWSLRSTDKKQVELVKDYGVSKQYVSKINKMLVKSTEKSLLKPKKSTEIKKSTKTKKPIEIKSTRNFIIKSTENIKKSTEKIEKKEYNGKRLIEISKKLDIVIDLLKEEKSIKRRELPSIPSNRPRTKEDIWENSYRKYVECQTTKVRTELNEFELSNKEWITERRKNVNLVNMELKKVLSEKREILEKYEKIKDKLIKV